MLNESDFTENQQVLIDRLYAGNVLAIAPVGFGKCACGQTAAQELIADGVCKRVLIVAPLRVCQLTWATEWQKWEHLYEPAMAIGDANQRSHAIERGRKLVVINNENIAWLTKNYNLKEWGFDGLIIDESTKYKSSGAGRVKALRQLRGKLPAGIKDFVWRVGLSASPVTEAGIEIYAQVLLVDAGKSLGRCQDVFRHKYFMTTDFQNRNWVFQPGGAERLAHALRHVVYTAEGEAYEDALPELVEHVHYVTLPDAAREAYRAMAKDMLAEIGDKEIEAANAAVMTGKLTQIASGAMYGEDKIAHRLHNEKIKWLKKFMKPRPRVLVSYWYQSELDALRKAFPGIAVLGDDPAKAESDWNNHVIDMLAVHPSSAGHGLNLQGGGHTLVCLGPVWSLDLWGQLLGRLRRRGQKSRIVTRHVIIAKDSIEEIMMERLKNKRINEKSILEHIKSAAEKSPDEPGF